MQPNASGASTAADRIRSLRSAQRLDFRFAAGASGRDVTDPAFRRHVTDLSSG
jgi:hypothetical protein